MTKKDFILRYVLAECSRTIHYSPELSIKIAKEIWDKVEKDDDLK